MGLGLIEEEVDVGELLRGGASPRDLHVLVPRGKDEQWIVARSPIQLHERVAWGKVRDGDFVYVPLVPYRTHADANRAIKFAVTIGLRMGLDISLIPNRDVKTLYMVTGDIADDLAEAEGVDAIRFYLGLAVRTQ